ncbi:MAG: hypothetical protein ILA34_06300 [Bacteroidaceae bacterium]|nr:hypothetical protein [Bacteroidaceae bacterium]
MATKRTLLLSTCFVLTSILCFLPATADDYIYIYSGGNITNIIPREDVDSVAFLSKNRIIRFYDKSGKGIFGSAVSSIDSMTFQYATPTADLLDVVFNANGSATDVSPMKNTVTLKGSSMSTYYNETYQRYVARFHQLAGMTPANYYRVDYESNAKFRNALADGHTLEAIFMVDYDTDVPTSNTIKFFASHADGGTGFSLGSGSHQLYFTHNVTTTGTSNYISIPSKIFPQSKVYYHAVAIWNKDEQKSYIYVNGVLQGTANAPGEFFFPESGAGWFAIGGDAKSDNLFAENSFHGEVVTARVYDKPLTRNDVYVLWHNLQKSMNSNATDLVTNINYWSGYALKVGYDFAFAVKGVQPGDQLQLTLISASSNNFTVDLTPHANDSASFVIPEKFLSGTYRMKLLRGESQQDLGLIKFKVVTQMPAAPLVYAHRGYWDTPGSAQNSITSYLKAEQLDIYGMELDVWLTTDDSIIVNHDATLNGVTIQTSSYDQVKDLKLSNGENVPRLEDFLELVKNGGRVKLLIEIKAHSTLARSYECIQKVMNAVNKAGVLDRCEFHTQDKNICAQITKIEPRAYSAPAYGSPTPQTVKNMGCSSYNNARAFINNPAWVAQTHALGMKATAWTPDQPDVFLDLINNGIDALGTNRVREAIRLREYYLYHQDK